MAVTMTFKKHFVPTIEEPALLAFEASLGYRLPNDYREFLLRYNGGEPEAPVCRWGRGAYKDTAVRYFFGITDEYTFSLANKYQIYARARRVPQWTLPIATDSGGNLILLALGEGRVGEVYFWDHDIEGLAEDPASPEHLALIAPSFEEFCNRLVPSQRRAH